MEQTLYGDGLKALQGDLANTEATRAAAILARTTDLLSPGVLSGWGITVNAGNSQLINIGAATGVSNIAYDFDGERITAPTPAATGVVLVNNQGAPNYIFLSYLPNPTDPRAHNVTGVLINTRQHDSFKIEVKTTIATTNFDSNGRRQILLGQVLNNYGTLVIIPPTGAVQIRAALLTLVGEVAWLDNPHFRFDRVGTVQNPLLTLRWASGNRFIVDQTTYALQGSASGQFAQGIPSFIIASLNKNVSIPTATIFLAPTTTNLAQLSIANQVLLGFISTDGTLSIVDGMLAEANPDDSGVFDGTTAAPVQPNSRLNQILFQLRRWFGGGSWQDDPSTLSGVIRGAVNLSQKTITLLSTILGNWSKFTGSSPVSDDNLNYSSATGHGHSGVDGDGPRLTMSALEVGVQPTLDLSSTPLTILKGTTGLAIVDDRDYRQHLVGGLMFRIVATVNWLVPTASATRVILNPTLLSAPISTGNGTVLYSQTLQLINPAGAPNPTTAVQVTVTVIGTVGSDQGKLRVSILVADESSSGGQYIQTLVVNKIGLVLFPVINAAASPIGNRLGLGSPVSGGTPGVPKNDSMPGGITPPPIPVGGATSNDSLAALYSSTLTNLNLFPSS